MRPRPVIARGLCRRRYDQVAYRRRRARRSRRRSDAAATDAIASLSDINLAEEIVHLQMQNEARISQLRLASGVDATCNDFLRFSAPMNAADAWYPVPLETQSRRP